MTDIANKPIVPSKESVKKAGEVIRNMDKAGQLELQKAYEILSIWRSLHAYPINAFSTHLRRVAKEGYKAPLVAQRLKRFDSILNKLLRIPQMSLARMQDIGGLRVILSDVESVYRFHAALIDRPSSRHTPILPPKDYIALPKADGYRSLHQVFAYKSRRYPELDGLKVELQLRSSLQHAWATAVETLGIIEKASFKTGEGSEQIRQYFKLASAIFAYAEAGAMPEGLVDCHPDSLVRQLKTLDSELRITEKIGSLAQTLKRLSVKRLDKNAYHLIELNLARHTISITAFSEGQIENAASFYQFREQETRNNPDISVVLLRAGDMQALQKAYPNYFLDAKLFLDNLAEYCKRFG